MSEPEFRNLVKVQEAINAGSLTLSQSTVGFLKMRQGQEQRHSIKKLQKILVRKENSLVLLYLSRM